MLGPIPSTPVAISLLALPDTTPTSLYGLYEVLSTAGVAWDQLAGSAPQPPARDNTPPFAVQIVGPGGGVIPSALGTPIGLHADFAAPDQAEIVIVTDLALPAAGTRGRWPEATAWLRRQAAGGAIVASVCTGSLLLAEAGLLDGVEATTHWAATPLFARHYPQTRLRPERILCFGGPEGRIITCGGSAAWEDLALHLIARYCGAEEAVRTSKIFLFGDRSEGQLAFAGMARPQRHEDGVIARCQAWIADNYHVANPVARMVALSGLPERTFKRRFRAATGYAPLDYVQTLRMEEAKQMLETTHAPTEEVAQRVGYEDPTFFRRRFKRQTGVTPARYRQRVQRLMQPIRPKAAGGRGQAAP